MKILTKTIAILATALIWQNAIAKESSEESSKDHCQNIDLPLEVISSLDPVQQYLVVQALQKQCEIVTVNGDDWELIEIDEFEATGVKTPSTLPTVTER